MEQLLEDYKRRLATIKKMRYGKNATTILRLDIKAACYRTFISELEALINPSKQ